MDSVKGRLLALESKLKDLEGSVQKVSGSVPVTGETRHDVFPREEFIEYDLYEELNTLKFAWKKKNITDGRTQSTCFEYHLLNQPEEIDELVGKIADALGGPIHPLGASRIILTSFCEKPEDLEKVGYTITILNPFVSGGIPVENERVKQKVKEELDKHFFHICPNGGNAGVNEHIPLSLFPQNITIPFAHEYERLPHVSFYLTLFLQCADVVCTVQSITTKEVTFNFTQPSIQNNRHNPYILPKNLMLHLNVRGIPTVTQGESIDLLV